MHTATFACTDHKSVLGRLPNEILSEVIFYLDSDSYLGNLLALCSTSHLFHNIATRILYKRIRLNTLSDIHACFSILRTYAGVPQKANFVGRLKITDFKKGAYRHDLAISENLIRELTPVFHSLRHLRRLVLFVDAPLNPLLRDLHLFELVIFKSSVSPSFSAALRSFTNRHPTITSLELSQNTADRRTHQSIPDFGRISLPHLREYTGPVSYVSGLVAVNKSVRIIIVTWRANDPHGPRVCGTGRLLDSRDCNPCPRMHHIAVLSCVLGDADRFSQHTIDEITHILAQFSALYVLKFVHLAASVADVGENTQWLEHDLEIVQSWDETSPTLCEITLHGRVWKRAQKVWVLQLK
ncbi:hypothetical protein DFH06DRAFT_1333040 [Mycena polygramma]|nr:hypothetical protein DFH06DRAFT_1333040 [Mycena polygramma]